MNSLTAEPDQVQDAQRHRQSPAGSTSLPMLKSMRIQSLPRTQVAAAAAHGICRWWTSRNGSGSFQSKIASLPRADDRSRARRGRGSVSSRHSSW